MYAGTNTLNPTRFLEKEQARAVAQRLQLPHTFLPVGGAEIPGILTDLVWKLDLPFGDPVTGPQYLLGRAAREAGLTAVFNGEGGDQLFGGWTSKPMISAEIYADLRAWSSHSPRGYTTARSGRIPFHSGRVTQTNCPSVRWWRTIAERRQRRKEANPSSSPSSPVCPQMLFVDARLVWDSFRSRWTPALKR